ncbi:MAG: hypothetical protein KF832_13870 [Caldilineaceae bacterium]|nr:hypothetical protein [Caldilineaceae bacterium]
MSNGSNSGDKRGDAGKGGNRRRYFRRRKPAQKAAESPAKPETRKQQDTPAKNRPRPQAKAESPAKYERDRRNNRRRRRRTRSERGDEMVVTQESALAPLEEAYIPPKSVFVYTYVLRPGVSSSHEFRPEHFSRVGRRLEDFEIDLSPLFPAEGTVKPEAKPALPLDFDDDEAEIFSDELAEE